ncbi:M28 family metallopeptidase [Thermomonospora umbrina]|uniref:Zn-dependent M28 family amino/carboxypeptidase n=1 Tax=Thermomonospora umbrina TaxID=111806 RepID=A0A3D9SHA0_9ACTN|nr:M28 family peptidase [Thermomonospora umbrina]REE95288.1 Zn-dependent M28 family amino/carboxypeptidase [Thermomonospora umbrina]
MPSERFLRPVSDVARPAESGLRATVEEFATIERAPCSAGEREAAHLIAHRLRMLGCEAAVEEEPAFDSYALPVGALAVLGAVAGAVGGRSRALGALGGGAAAVGLADEISYGRQLARRVVSRRRTACNVVAESGDRGARRTLVVMAHHDAAPSGAIFDQTLERWFVRRFPGVVERMTENPPLWWAALAGPALAGLGSATGSAGLRRTGAVMSAVTAAAMADIGSRRPVPGANDNLSGVAVLIALAEAFRARPVEGLRVILFSAGAEEALQEGARGFARRHFPRLPRERTWFLNLDTVGSGNLVMLDAEGPLRMEPYHAAFGDLVARCAKEQGVPLRRGLRSRNSTDGVVPNRHGYPTACVVSVDDDKLLPHYHLPTDLPEHVDYGCVADAALLSEAVARTLTADA